MIQPSTSSSSAQVISTILKHDNKQTSYKIALLRAINDVALAFPDLHTYDKNVAVPLRLLAQFWVAYYWPFMSPAQPIMQGPRARKGGTLHNDVAFRAPLTTLRQQWEMLHNTSRPAEGFFLINELRVPRKRATYPPDFLSTYEQALRSIANTIQMPIRYAGPGQWTVFAKPARLNTLSNANVVAVPGTLATDVCLVIPVELWLTFRDLSLWIEALCIHEWCLFSERVDQPGGEHTGRGTVYSLLTDRPDNRRPLTWERNQVDLLLLEGRQFTCPWTHHPINSQVQYDIDHLLPIAVYPINELWNLVPSDPRFNSHIKRDRIPSSQRLQAAQPHLILAYTNYDLSPNLSRAMHEDAALRFSSVTNSSGAFSTSLAQAATDFIEQVAQLRNLARF